MMDLFRAFVLKTTPTGLPDEAVKYAVNLAAQVHNLLHEYELGMQSGEYERFVAKMYEVSADFHTPEGQAAREAMRQEWGRRCSQRP